ncbi:hypothetical protein GGS23DRAFT_564944 [Durotheca rogersii]|uniref:uncharacterized protein n=1 Tax=Durotheca rogersii TaxID=419775 RepID=UPI00221F50F6|nr:uncharacterized protein GGS23DRAFT_564944 [Durotheca rogersii]KAI5863681.1 hypothetical protein GGS23DRAFT_564944 [Durotheca rogersii]
MKLRQTMATYNSLYLLGPALLVEASVHLERPVFGIGRPNDRPRLGVQGGWRSLRQHGLVVFLEGCMLVTKHDNGYCT